jgi:uncharacterized protein YyaL (SSP411 family)
MEHKFTNQLIHETSPYLLQHAHNPVNWYPWGPEALRLAREQGKPIFLSIGYAACHWCHVMEHESFEDEAVAAILNEHFVSIKVDREERPDLDEIYMNATILFTRGQGGWPMSVWLTPEGQPFFAGTYFPPRDMYGRAGFSSVLLRVAEIWREKTSAVVDDAAKVTEILSQPLGMDAETILSRDEVASLVQKIAGAFDTRQGGLASGSNKFPPSMAMELLLRENRVNPNQALADVVSLTLEKMARGGIYDHLGGGIHRYSTDSKWLVPHFEKMLYDQALVSSIYLDGYAATRRHEFAATARGIFEYVLRNLRSGEGGLYSTEDADSEGKEGMFYIWTWEQVMDALGDAEGALFAFFYDVTATGNWDHPGDAHVPEGPKNILRILRSPEEAARVFSVAPAELERRLSAAREKLFAVRETRTRPGLDDKILTAWNGLMIAALAKGAAVLPDASDSLRYREAAAKAGEFVLSKLQHDGRLLRSFRNGQAKLMAYIDDYAFLIEGLISLYEITGSLRWLDEAERLTETAIRFYWDASGGGFYFTASDHEQLIVRSKVATDNAIPSGNSVMAMNLLKLHLLLNHSSYRDKATAILSLYSGAARQNPFAHERLLSAVESWHEGFQEIAIIGPMDSPQTQELLRTVHSRYLPNKVITLLDLSWPDASEIASRLPLLADKKMVDGKPTAYVCRNYACQSPTTDPRRLGEQLQHAQ